MSGFCGIFHLDNRPADQDNLKRMLAVLGHRGGDGTGIRLDGPCGLACAYQNVFDHTKKAAQPLFASYQPGDLRDASNQELLYQAMIVHDGAVYNHQEIHAPLQAMRHRFTSESDTEVLVRAYLQFGSPNFIKSFRGTFAFAIWDVVKKQLILARDRLGHRPLYYAWQGTTFIFASEIKALLAYPGLSTRPNETLVPHFLAYGYRGGQETLFEGIYSLPHGSVLRVSPDLAPPAYQEQLRYWDIPLSSSDTDPRDEDNIAVDLLAHLRWSIRQYVTGSDPVAVWISGGLDSAAILALVSELGAGHLVTLSYNTGSQEIGESDRTIRKLQARFVSHHHDLSYQEPLEDALYQLVQAFDSPLSDPAVINTYFAARAAREIAPVVLTGHGGNGIFAGYDYFRSAQLSSRMDQLPSAAAQALEAALGLLPEAALNQGIFQQAALFTRSAQLSLAGRYLNWLRFLPADWLKALMGDETEQRISDEFQAFFVPDTDLSEKNTFARLLDANLNFYIPHMMLPRLERTASFAGIDIRTPFLDHHLLQFVQDIPIHLKTRQRASRHILWRAVEDLLPRQVLDNRQKQTFSANADPWIKGELQAATAGMLLSDQARIRAYVNPEALKDLVTAGSNQSLGRAVWTLLSFEIWLQTYFG